MEQDAQTRVLNRDPTAPHPSVATRVVTGPQAAVAAVTGNTGSNGAAPTRVGRYELVRRLAHGGMATVYLGRASGAAGFEKVVAIKIIHAHLADEPDFLEMFFDEARIAAQIRHPHVVEILDLGSEAGRHYMVMEWVEGETLSALVRAMRPGTLPLPVILQILADTLEGLIAAHEADDGDGRHLNLVHRDVSPQNLLISMSGWLKVTDFGIVKAAGRHGRTRTGELRGKVAYMSPEQARGLPVDARSDLFAVGIIAWELLHADRLFARSTDAATLERVIACEVPRVHDDALEGCGEELAEGVRAWVARSLERDPDRRPESARAMLEELRPLIRLAGDSDARATLSSIMKSEFGERLAYVRAALRESTPSTVALAPEPPVLGGPGHTASTSLSAGIQEATGLGGPKRAWAALLILPLVGAAAAVAIAMAAGLTGTADTRNGDSSAAETGAESPAPTPAVAQTVNWFVTGQPEGASIRIDGELHSKLTPTNVVLPRSETPVVVVVEKAGMAPMRQTLSPLADDNVTYRLEPLPAETGPAPAPTGPAAATGDKPPVKKRRIGPTKVRDVKPPSDEGGKATPSSDSGGTGLRPMPDFDEEGGDA